MGAKLTRRPRDLRISRLDRLLEGIERKGLHFCAGFAIIKWLGYVPPPIVRWRVHPEVRQRPSDAGRRHWPQYLLMAGEAIMCTLITRLCRNNAPFSYRAAAHFVSLRLRIDILYIPFGPETG